MSCTKLTLVASEFRIVFGNYGLQASVLVFTESKNRLCWWEYTAFIFPDQFCPNPIVCLLFCLPWWVGTVYSPQQVLSIQCCTTSLSCFCLSCFWFCSKVASYFDVGAVFKLNFVLFAMLNRNLHLVSFK